MQRDFDFNYPSLEIDILGVNEVGYDSNNSGITSGRDLPWLQDVDADNNGVSDVWYDSWEITYRDVWVVDQLNDVVLKYNLTSNSLGVQANYDLLKGAFVDTAATPAESLWQNPIEPLDVNGDGAVGALDALLVVNELGRYPNGVPPQSIGGQSPYIDPSGDGIVAPLDALIVINQLTYISSQRSSRAASNDVAVGELDTDSSVATNGSSSASGVASTLRAPDVDQVFAGEDDDSDDDDALESRSAHVFLS